MTDKHILILSIVGIAIFAALMRFLWATSAGKPNQRQLRRTIKIASTVYGVAMAIQLASVLTELLK